MKFSFMSFSFPNLDFEQLVKAAKDYGYNGIEPRIDAGHKHGLERGSTQLNQMREIAEQSGIAICCIATSCKFADKTTQSETIDEAKIAIDLAAQTNAPVIRVFGGKIPNDRAESLNAIAESLIKLSDYARSNNVTICLETHDDWCNPQHIADIMNAVNNPYIAVNWDIMHPVMTAGWTVEQSFDALKPWIKHVHAHDGLRESGKGIEYKTIGSGGVDHAAAMQLLKESGYNGYVSGEWINWEPGEVHLPRELAKLKKFIGE